MALLPASSDEQGQKAGNLWGFHPPPEWKLPCTALSAPSPVTAQEAKIAVVSPEGIS